VPPQFAQGARQPVLPGMIIPLVERVDKEHLGLVSESRLHDTLHLLYSLRG
jgi:hypothetical protein